jgi:hypothetical protein
VVYGLCMDDTEAADPQPVGSGKYGRLNIRINAATSAAIKALGEPDDTSPTEVIRRAVALLKLVDDRRKEGLSVWFVDPDGKRQARLELLY